jgi:type I restriction enzyme S subunit
MKFAGNWGQLGMKCKLSDICSFRKGKIKVEELNTKTYISTENMLPNKGGITAASSLPSVELTQEYKIGDVLVSNIRPYFKKIWKANCNGGCSNDVLVFEAKADIDRDFLYYVLANDDFFTYSMTTSKGTKMPRGDKTSIMQYAVPSFDLTKQKKIASILRTLDDKIEVNNAINNNLVA